MRWKRMHMKHFVANREHERSKRASDRIMDGHMSAYGFVVHMYRKEKIDKHYL